MLRAIYGAVAAIIVSVSAIAQTAAPPSTQPDLGKWVTKHDATPFLGNRLYLTVVSNTPQNIDVKISRPKNGALYGYNWNSVKIGDREIAEFDGNRYQLLITDIKDERVRVKATDLGPSSPDE